MSGMRGVTVRQLQIFATAAERLSFSETSRALHLTQPAVSMQIRQLEDSAGLPLFERSGRSIRLTQAGEEMQHCARQVLAALHEAEETFAALKGLRGGRVTIAVVSTSKYFAPKLLAQFSERHPDVEIRLTVNNREAVVGQLDRNEVDLAIMGTPPAALDCNATAFAPHPLVIVAAPTHPFARRRSIPLSALADQTFVVREPGSGTRSSMERFFGSHRLQPKIGMEMSSNETIKQAVMAGMGLAFLSLHTVGLELATHQLVVLRVEDLPVMRQWFLVHRSEKRLAPAALAFKSFVLQEGGEFVKRWAAQPIGGAK
jgi:DNA-binding transcriptional LysR family regulator